MPKDILKKPVTKADFVHPGARSFVNDIGKTMHDRDRMTTGVVSNVTMRNCAACGYAPCYIVKWRDGKITKPCVKGVESLPDGSLHIT